MLVSISYKRPPITEAVIEIRFQKGVGEGSVQKLQANFAQNYAQFKKVKALSVHVEVGKDGQLPHEAKIEEANEGFRFSSKDETEIAIFDEQKFLVSQLAPYVGWDTFFDRFQRDWSVHKKTTGYIPVSRIGVRYVNRIDIPYTEDIWEQSDYLTVYVETPEKLGPQSAYNAKAEFAVPIIDGWIKVNTSSMASPLEGHISVLLDTDVFKATDVPQKDEDMYSLINQIRAIKNDAFEMLITEETRRLFST